ncbi:MAG: hypothetical protein ACP5T7_04140 [bacterium]
MRIKLGLLAFIIMVVFPIKVQAFSASSTGLVSLRYQTGQHLSLLSPGVKYPDAGFVAAYLMPELDVTQGEWFNGAIELYSGELSYRTFSNDSLNLYGVQNVNDYFNDTYFIRQAYVDFSPDQSIEIYAGEREIIGGSRLLFDNYQPSLTFDYNFIDTLDVPLSFEFNAVKVEPYKLYDPSRTSMFYEAELSYNFSLFEYVTMFYANFEDTDNTLAPMLNNIIYYTLFNRTEYNALVNRYGRIRADRIIACLQQEYYNGGPIHSSKSNINWFGITGDRYFGFFELNLTGMLEMGNGNIDGNNCLNYDSPFTRHFNTYGYLADVKFKYHIHDFATIGIFFNLSSGDKTPWQAILKQGTLNSFISVFPYNTESNLFFNGGINQNLNTGTMAMAGRRGLGDVAYGGIVDIYPVKSIEFTFTPVLLYPEITDKSYGFEADFTFTYTLNKYISFPFETDYFSPGDFFQDYKVSDIYQILFGADIKW